MNRRGFLSAIGAAVIAGCSESAPQQPDDSTTQRPTTERGTGPTTRGRTEPEQGTASSTTRTTASTDPNDREYPIRGVSLSPQSFEAQDYQAFLELITSADLALRWAGPWAELGQPQAAPSAVMNQAAASDIVPVIDTGVYSVGRSELFRPLDQATVDSYLDAATLFAAQHQPPYLGLGTEVNIHAEEQPDEFETYVSLFEEVAAAVKSVSPETQVYVSYQLEWLMGLRGGLFGEENDPSLAQWELLDRFSMADLVGLTTYPGIIYTDPADIPDDHYAAIDARTDKPFVIVETGWTYNGSDVSPEWASSETEQAAFVQRLTDLTADLDLQLLIWLFAYQQSGVNPPFDAMALRRDDGTARPAWDAWTENSP